MFNTQLDTTSLTIFFLVYKLSQCSLKLNSQNHINSESTLMCVINDPLGQTHSPTSYDYIHVLFFDMLKSEDGRKENTNKNNNHCQSGLWFGRVDQLSFKMNSIFAAAVHPSKLI